MAVSPGGLVSIACADPQPLADFWAAMLDGEIIPVRDGVIVVRSGGSGLLSCECPTMSLRRDQTVQSLEDNITNPLAPWRYGVSTLHCMTVSLAHGGAGLGTAWGEQQARQMLIDTGCNEPTTQLAPGDPMDTIYVTTRPHHRSDLSSRTPLRPTGCNATPRSPP